MVGSLPINFFFQFITITLNNDFEYATNVSPQNSGDDSVENSDISKTVQYIDFTIRSLNDQSESKHTSDCSSQHELNIPRPNMPSTCTTNSLVISLQPFEVEWTVATIAVKHIKQV